MMLLLESGKREEGGWGLVEGWISGVCLSIPFSALAPSCYLHHEVSSPCHALPAAQYSVSHGSRIIEAKVSGLKPLRL